jgi:hypothetical protein
MTALDRANWPKAKCYDVVQSGPGMVVVVPRHDGATPEEISTVTVRLIADVIVFQNSGGKLS